MKLEIIGKNKQISLKVIEKVEKNFNISFPNGYKDFLLKTNGGRVQECMVFKSNNERVEPFEVREFSSLERVEELLGYIKEETDEFILNNENEELFLSFYKYFKNKMFIIGETYTSFDLSICHSGENIGKVYCVDNVHDDEFLLLANSFDAFMNNFEPVTEEELETGKFHFQSEK